MYNATDIRKNKNNNGFQNTICKNHLWLFWMLADMLREAGHADHTFVQDLCHGFNVSGHVSVGGIGKTVEGGLLRKGRLAHGVQPDINNLFSCGKESANDIARPSVKTAR